MQAPRPLIQRLLLQNVRRYQKGGATAETLREPMMNELHVPQGAWADLHAKRQQKFNRPLIVGIVLFTGSIIFGKATNLLYFNACPPDSID